MSEPVGRHDADAPDGGGERAVTRWPEVPQPGPAGDTQSDVKGLQRPAAEQVPEQYVPRHAAGASGPPAKPADRSGMSSRSDRSVRRHVIITSGITALGGLLFGYDTGVISGALLYVKDDLGYSHAHPMPSFQQELVTSLLLVGAVIGASVTGRVADQIGRRKTVLITAVIFVVGVLLAAFSPSLTVLLAARLVIGLAVGGASMVVPLYIGEAAPPHIRGGLVSLNQLAITIGILVSYLTDYWLAGTQNWRLMFGLAAIPAVLLFVGMLFQRESPAWLIKKGRIDQARTVLARLRYANDDIDQEIREVQEVSRTKTTSTREMFSRALRPMLMVGVMLAIFQQITGINTIIYYAPNLLASAGFGDKAALLANVANGVVNVSMTIVAIRLLDRVGRRVLLLTGTVGMAVGMTLTGCSFIAGEDLHGTRAIVAVLGLFIYTGSFAIGLGPVFWLLISEIYPLNVRGAAMSIAAIANWGANFVVAVSFLTLKDAIGNMGVFFLFGALTLVALGYFYLRVPETKGRSLQQLEQDLVR